MSTDLANQSTSTALTIHPDQTSFTSDQQAALQQLGVQANSAADVAVFFHQAKRSGLDPFKREIYMITRQGKATIQTGIDGFYKIADRATRATGGTWGIPETLWCGEDGRWTDVWLSRQAPAAAKVTVERNGARFTTVAVTAEYMATGRDGKPSNLWAKMPARMIAKCAEALAIRRAFPDDLSGLYTSEEMAQADNAAPAPAPRPQAAPQRAPRPTLGEAVQNAAPSAPDWRPTWERVKQVLMEAGVTGSERDLLAAAASLADKRYEHPQELTEEDVARIEAECAPPNAETPQVVEAEVIDDTTHNAQEG